MPDFRLPPHEIAVLKTEHRKQRDRKKADRIKAIVLFGSGWSVIEVAQALLVEGYEDRFSWAAGLFSEFEFDRAIREVFQEGDFVQHVLRNV